MALKSFEAAAADLQQALRRSPADVQIQNLLAKARSTVASLLRSPQTSLQRRPGSHSMPGAISMPSVSLRKQFVRRLRRLRHTTGAAWRISIYRSRFCLLPISTMRSGSIRLIGRHIRIEVRPAGPPAIRLGQMPTKPKPKIWPLKLVNRLVEPFTA